MESPVFYKRNEEPIKNKREREPYRYNGEREILSFIKRNEEEPINNKRKEKSSSFGGKKEKKGKKRKPQTKKKRKKGLMSNEGQVEIVVKEDDDRQSIPTHRGIPEANMVDITLITTETEAQQEFIKTEELYRKYKVWENNLESELSMYRANVPPIEETLEMVGFLEMSSEKKEPIDTRFKLSDSLFAAARVEDVKNVFLWLGASVMMEFSLKEARELLENNIKAALSKMETIRDDLKYLRTQIETSEVNKSRIQIKAMQLVKGT